MSLSSMLEKKLDMLATGPDVPASKLTEIATAQNSHGYPRCEAHGGRCCTKGALRDGSPSCEKDIQSQKSRKTNPIQKNFITKCIGHEEMTKDQCSCSAFAELLKGVKV